jgi:asparagine synthase (glutamine-hydrolysing)
VSSTIDFTVDDVVKVGLETQGRPLETSLDVATEEFKTVAGHIHNQYDDIILGLSGGKDSRLIAASLVAAGRVPRFATNNDIPAEGETARELVRILSEKRGITIDHTVKLAAQPANVFAHGLRDRVVRLQHRYDYQFPYTYAVRPALAELLPDKADRANITGAGGELATGYWYAKPDDKPEPDEIVALNHLVPDVTGIDPAAVEQERERVLAILQRGKDLGVQGPHMCDYLYLVERVRRWYSSAYSLSMITPFLHPAMVAVMFSLTAEQKRDRVLHTSLTDRLVPEWADVPYVTGYSPTSTVPKVWEGDGLKVIADLIDTAQGPIAKLLDERIAEQLLVTPKGSARKSLQRFAYMAVASQQLEPHTVQPSTNETYRRVVAQKKAQQKKPSVPRPRRRPATTRDKVLARMQWIKRTPVGRAVWNKLRAQIRRG